MNSDQKLHLGMINSFNVISGKATFEEIVESGIGVFAHMVEDLEDMDIRSVRFMILYFENLEMFEECGFLLKYIEENYNEDGSYKTNECDCDYPNIKIYVSKPKCSVCNKRLKI